MDDDLFQQDSIFEGAAGYDDGLGADFSQTATDGPQPNDGRTDLPPVTVPLTPPAQAAPPPPQQTVMPGTWPGVDTSAPSQGSSVLGDLAASVTYAFFGGVIGYALAPSKEQRAYWAVGGALSNALLGPLAGAVVLGGMGYTAAKRRRGG
mgnify:CR=1 FL=1